MLELLLVKPWIEELLIAHLTEKRKRKEDTSDPNEYDKLKAIVDFNDEKDKASKSKYVITYTTSVRMFSKLELSRLEHHFWLLP